MAAGFPDGGGASYSPNWVRYIPAYLPLSSISSSWVPFSEIRPSSINRMRSESRMVESRWAIIKEVRPRVSVSFRCGPDALRQTVLIPVADIVPDTHAKERRILKHHAEGAAQIRQPVLPEMAAV